MILPESLMRVKCESAHLNLIPETDKLGYQKSVSLILFSRDRFVSSSIKDMVMLPVQKRQPTRNQVLDN